MTILYFISPKFLYLLPCLSSPWQEQLFSSGLCESLLQHMLMERRNRAHRWALFAQ